MTELSAGILRSACAGFVVGTPPTIAELWNGFDTALDAQQKPTIEQFRQTTDELVRSGLLIVQRGRYFPSVVPEDERKLTGSDEWLPRKLRKARKVTRWLSRLCGVRAVLLCNRTAFGLPRDEGDLDFLVIVRQGSIWQTRALAGLPFVLLRDRPQPGASERDAVCLSFFLSDRALDLSDCLLSPDDVYFRHWFLGLLPLFDDGVLTEFWKANAKIRARHVQAEPWIISPDLRVLPASIRIPCIPGLEMITRHLQWKYFPRALRERANVDTQVMISDERLKFHVDDGRIQARAQYEALCQRYGIAP